METEYTKDQLCEDLWKLGVNQGDHIGLGISFKSIGKIRAGPETFIDALLAAVGKDGTIMMPSYTHFFPLSQIKARKIDYVFDYKTTKGTTGLLPEVLRNRRGTLRSKHPTNSVVALGSAAEYLTREHDENATAYLPYSRLAELRGKTLSIGIGDKLVGIRHEAQYLAGLLTLVPFKIGVRYRDDNGEIQLFIRRDKGGCVKRLPEFVPELRRQGLVKEGNVGIGASLLIPSQDILRVMVDLLKKNPALNVCDDISCLWCREVERRLALYDTIENPAYFQKSRLLRKLIAIRNGFRLRR